jgi:hypothetical protein
MMLQSHIIDIDGTFVGAAVRVAEGYKFVAVGTRLQGLDGRVVPALAELRRIARSAYHSGRIPAPPPAAQMVTQVA